MTDNPNVIRRDALQALYKAALPLKDRCASYGIAVNALRIATEHATSTGDETKYRFEAMGFVEGTRQTMTGLEESFSPLPREPLYAALSHARDLLRWENPKHYDSVMRDIAPTVKALEDLARG